MKENKNQIHYAQEILSANKPAIQDSLLCKKV